MRLTIFNSISLFLMGIVSISLLVAGVSIMKAVGASRKDVLKMFMMEALFLGIAASIVGGILSLGGGFVVNILILKESSYFFAPSNFLYIIAGVLFGVVTSLAGGMYAVRRVLMCGGWMLCGMSEVGLEGWNGALIKVFLNPVLKNMVS